MTVSHDLVLKIKRHKDFRVLLDALRLDPGLATHAAGTPLAKPMMVAFDCHRTDVFDTATQALLAETVP